MTIIAIKDGVIVADSWTQDYGVLLGSVQKIVAVPEDHGGGFIAGVGTASHIYAAIDTFLETGIMETAEKDGPVFLWLRSGGQVFRFEDGKGWYSVVADYHAIGAGWSLAIGAMAYGASAFDAVGICCKLHASCGGKITYRNLSGSLK